MVVTIIIIIKTGLQLLSFESAQQVVTELVEIQEVEDEEAQALSDAMDKEVRSRLFQRCRSKNHPECFAPYPKGWQNGLHPAAAVQFL